MKNVKIDLKKLFLYLGVLFLVVNLTSCSDDDDNGTVQPEPTGSFELSEDEYTLSGNTLTLENITVGQTSWLVAVNPGSENSNNFISEPVMLMSGENNNVELNFNEGAITDDGSGQQVVLKLYADNPDGGTIGEWDSSDQPIMDGNNVLMTETITVFAENSGGTFADFDTNADGSLDATEVSGTYQNNFTEWDADGDGSLNSEEFYNTSFANTDANDDDGIDEDEWNAGFAGMYGNWSDDDFATFDADANGTLSNDEWNTTFGESQWFETYDADTNTLVTEDEWNTGLFGDWDTDADGSINEDEFNNYSPYVGNW